MKKIMIIGLIFIIIVFIVGFSIYREVSREGYCTQKIQELQAKNSHLDWAKQVEAPEGFKIRNIPLSLKEEITCEREQKDFLLF